MLLAHKTNLRIFGRIVCTFNRMVDASRANLLKMTWKIGCHLIIAFHYSNTLLAICCKIARNIDILMSFVTLKYHVLRLKTESVRTFGHLYSKVRPYFLLIPVKVW